MRPLAAKLDVAQIIDITKVDSADTFELLDAGHQRADGFLPKVGVSTPPWTIHRTQADNLYLEAAADCPAARGGRGVKARGKVSLLCTVAMALPACCPS